VGDVALEPRGEDFALNSKRLGVGVTARLGIRGGTSAFKGDNGGENHGFSREK
jgi:hypothetical protein